MGHSRTGELIPFLNLNEDWSSCDPVSPSLWDSGDVLYPDTGDRMCLSTGRRGKRLLP